MASWVGDSLTGIIENGKDSFKGLNLVLLMSVTTEWVKLRPGVVFRAGMSLGLLSLCR